jgi:hypothetical protein
VKQYQCAAVQLPFVLDDKDRIRNFMGIAHALRANGERASSDGKAAAALTRGGDGDSGCLSSHSSDADALKAKSLDVQSQSSQSSSVFSLGGLLGGMRLGSNTPSEKGGPAPKEPAAAALASRAASTCVPRLPAELRLHGNVACHNR